MRRKSILFLLPLCAIAAAGCAGNPDLYYTVDVYSDYEGMEADLANLGHYVTSKATRIGYCYAIRGEKAQIAGMHTLKDDAGKSYYYRTSHRDPGHGYKYVFNEFVGHYSDNYPIDLANISENCSVFTTFTKEKQNYLVTIKDAYGEIHGGVDSFVPYLSKGEEIEGFVEALSTFPAHDKRADPEDPTTWRDPYYVQYVPVCWDISIYDEEDVLIDGGLVDDKGKAISARISAGNVDAFKAFTVTNRTNFKAVYDDTARYSYDVTINYLTREDNGSGGYDYQPMDAGITSSLPQSGSYEYGHDFSNDSLLLSGYRFIGNGVGTPDYYPDVKALPYVLREYRDNGSGEKEFLPSVVDRHFLRYSCTLNFVYEAVHEAHIRFHDDLEHPDAFTEKVVTLGDKAIAPSVSGLPAGKTLPGGWTKTFGGYTSYDLSVISEEGTFDLYPIVLDETLVSPAGFQYRYDKDQSGYVLTALPALTVEVNDNIRSTGLFPAEYPLVGIESFDLSSTTPKVADGITSITLPQEISSIAHGLLRTAPSCQSIDLSASSLSSLAPGAMSNLSLLEQVLLPHNLDLVNVGICRNATSLKKVWIPKTITRIETTAFNNCAALTDIYFEGTLEQWNGLEGHDSITATIHPEANTLG